MYLYILKSDKNWYKLGITQNLEARMKSYNTHNPNYELIAVFSGKYNDILILEKQHLTILKTYFLFKNDWVKIPKKDFNSYLSFLNKKTSKNCQEKCVI
jgi:hypothetical protein